MNWIRHLLQIEILESLSVITVKDKKWTIHERESPWHVQFYKLRKKSWNSAQFSIENSRLKYVASYFNITFGLFVEHDSKKSKNEE